MTLQYKCYMFIKQELNFEILAPLLCWMPAKSRGQLLLSFLQQHIISWKTLGQFHYVRINKTLENNFALFPINKSHLNAQTTNINQTTVVQDLHTINAIKLLAIFCQQFRLKNNFYNCSIINLFINLKLRTRGCSAIAAFSSKHLYF